MATTVAHSSRIPFTTTQKKILLTLASAVALRMLGLFLVLPVFTLYGLQFTSSRFLAGFAFGCYGLAMAVSEIPLGRLSDRVGRRRILLYGMSMFSLGSFLCAIPHWFPPSVRIWELIVARLFQGSGGVVSTAFATVADHIEPERRSLGMAVLGIPIGISFFLGVVAGPILAGHFGTAVLFWLTGIVGAGSVVILARSLPDVAPRPRALAPVSEILSSPSLVALDVSGFLINFLMSSFFFYFPLITSGRMHLTTEKDYTVLLPTLLLSGVTTLGFSYGADHRGQARPLAALAFLCFLPSALIYFRPEMLGFAPERLLTLQLAGAFFFIAYTALEPILPSMVSKTAPASASGTALGFYQTSQFMGSVVGASVGGALSRFPWTYMMAIWIVVSIGGVLLTRVNSRTAAAR